MSKRSTAVCLLVLPLVSCGGMAGVPKEPDHDLFCRANMTDALNRDFFVEMTARGDTLKEGAIRGYVDHAATALCQNGGLGDPALARQKVTDFVARASGECRKGSVQGCWSTEGGLKAGAGSLCPGFWPFC